MNYVIIVVSKFNSTFDKRWYLILLEVWFNNNSISFKTSSLSKIYVVLMGGDDICSMGVDVNSLMV